ncbi:trimeric intracellular cation channel family protein [Olsenella profusa]|uniref:trimeric intracellular cation channel family protein n=1 Tax=Olsenella profusa TaxID=138595 RepID=UPI00315B0058
MPEIFSTINPEFAAVSLPTWVDLASVIVGSAGGVLVARVRHLDAVGFVGLALLCGLGGGLIRDVMMQVGSVYMLDSPFAILASAATGLLGFLFPRSLDSVPNLLEWLDIMAVALFALVGTDKALVYGMLPASCVLMGIMTGVGGGMLRDVFLGEVPRIFQRSNLYAVCALAGSVVYYLAVVLCSLNKLWGAVLCILVTIGLRRWSLRFNVKTPADVDLAPRVVEPVQRAARRVRVTRWRKAHRRSRRG